MVLALVEVLLLVVVSRVGRALARAAGCGVGAVSRVGRAAAAAALGGGTAAAVLVLLLHRFVSADAVGIQKCTSPLPQTSAPNPGWGLPHSSF